MKKSEMIGILVETANVSKAGTERSFNATFDLFKKALTKGEKSNPWI